MFVFRASFSVLMLYVIISSTIGATLNPPNSYDGIEKGNITQPADSVSYDIFDILDDNEQPTEPTPTNNKTSIVYGVSNNDEQRFLECECGAPDLCPAENVIALPTNYSKGEKCPASDVCCDKSTSTLPPSPQPTESTPLNNTKVIIYGVSNEDELRELECTCVLFTECSNEDLIPLPTAYSNGEVCEVPDVCCNSSNSTSPTIPQPTESTPPNNTKTTPLPIFQASKPTLPTTTGIIHRPPVRNETKKVECNCVDFCRCPFDIDIELTGKFYTKNLCHFPNICCKFSPSPSVYQTTTPAPFKNITGIRGSPTLNKSEESECKCVASNQCPSDDIDLEQTINYHKKKVCNLPNVCCKKPNSRPSTPLQPNRDNFSYFNYPTSFVQTICKCVVSHRCPTKDIMRIPSRIVQCPTPTVCCKTSELPGNTNLNPAQVFAGNFLNSEESEWTFTRKRIL